MDLSIVIPVFNEADNIPLLFWELHGRLQDHLRYEVIFVDDASTDDTAAVIANLMEQCPHVRTVRHRRNGGQSAALLSGVRAASAAWVATMDGDGQNDPADLQHFWQLKSEANPPIDLIIGHRQARQDNVIRILSSRIANGVRSRLLGDGVPDTGCGIKLFRRACFLDLPYFDHMHRFLPALIQRDGGRVMSVPVNHRPRVFGLSKYGMGNRLWVGIVDLLGVMWLLRRRRLTVPPESTPSNEY
ncbi:MAG: glycosyltransferase family 2 protein [Aquisalimonadaceae bacterium]